MLELCFDSFWVNNLLSQSASWSSASANCFYCQHFRTSWYNLSQNALLSSWYHSVVSCLYPWIWSFHKLSCRSWANLRNWCCIWGHLGCCAEVLFVVLGPVICLFIQGFWCPSEQVALVVFHYLNPEIGFSCAQVYSSSNTYSPTRNFYFSWTWRHQVWEASKSSDSQQ